MAPSPAPLSRAAPARQAIRVRHLWHRFGGVDVLRDVTFDVAEGEIFGFIGPNGAGKTTTLRVMATLLEPMSGRVEIDGIDVTIDPDAVRRRIGYMPDHAGVYDRITVREYLEFFADAFRVPSDLGVVATVLELTDLVRIQDKLVATLSKGMKQRLQLGRILLHDPKVLILDEPASDLDPRARIEIRDLLIELRGLGKTILLSSHILSELSDVCTSIGILERGALVVAGPIEEIAERLDRTHREGRAILGAAPRGGDPNEASLHGGRVQNLKLRVLGDPHAAAHLLRGGPGVVEATVATGVVHVAYVGDDAKIAAMVGHLVGHGVGVVGVEPERRELERIFLEVTRGDAP
jgi:ABC-2 type transport system ATP-binding protein